MFAPPLNGKKDEVRVRPSVAGHFFDPISDRCSCGKVYSDISAAPESAIGDDRQSGLWCHQGTLTRFEWQQIQDRNAEIMACCRS